MTSTNMEPPFVQSTVPYWSSAPSEYYAGTVDQYRRKYNHQPTRIYDMRGIDSSLDVHGFQLVQHPSSECTFKDPERIKSTFYAETAELIRRVTGASRVHCYSHLVRTAPPEVARAMAADPNIPGSKIIGATVPSPGAHIDHSASGSLDILRDNLPAEEVSRLQESGRRWAIINLWRPIKPVQRDPLCVCDARTVVDKDLIERVVRLPPPGANSFENVSKGRSFRTVAVSANPSHKWYYVSSMQPDEALLLKIHDSKDGVASSSPHTSFTIPGTEDCETRNSIEVRCLVFYNS